MFIFSSYYPLNTFIFLQISFIFLGIRKIPISPPLYRPWDLETFRSLLLYNYGLPHLEKNPSYLIYWHETCFYCRGLGGNVLSGFWIISILARFHRLGDTSESQYRFVQASQQYQLFAGEFLNYASRYLVIARCYFWIKFFADHIHDLLLVKIGPLHLISGVTSVVISLGWNLHSRCST